MVLKFLIKDSTISYWTLFIGKKSLGVLNRTRENVRRRRRRRATDTLRPTTPLFSWSFFDVQSLSANSTTFIPTISNKWFSVVLYTYRVFSNVIMFVSLQLTQTYTLIRSSRFSLHLRALLLLINR